MVFFIKVQLYKDSHNLKSIAILSHRLLLLGVGFEFCKTEWLTTSFGIGGGGVISNIWQCLQEAQPTAKQKELVWGSNHVKFRTVLITLLISFC